MVLHIVSDIGGDEVRVKGGRLKKNIEIDAGEWEYVEIPCRSGSTIYIDAYELDGETFNVYIVPSDDVKRAPILGTVTEFDETKALWSKEKVPEIKKKYVAKERDTLYVFFDNYHAKSRYKSIDIDIRVEHPPLSVGDEPLRESIDIDPGYLETIEIDAKQGDVIRVFGRVTKGKDITIHVLSKIYETPDYVHIGKSYYTAEKIDEIDIDYQCRKTEPLLVVLDNTYSRRTMKTVDVSIVVIRGGESGAGEWVICPFCQQKNPLGSTECSNCGARL